jgi:hypothetical protein
MPKTNNVLLIVVIVLVSLGGWYLWGPSGGSLTALNEGNFQFTGQFQSAANDERMLILVSPT